MSNEENTVDKLYTREIIFKYLRRLKKDPKEAVIFAITHTENCFNQQVCPDGIYTNEYRIRLYADKIINIEKREYYTIILLKFNCDPVYIENTLSCDMVEYLNARTSASTWIG